jgi:hypothetical protein
VQWLGTWKLLRNKCTGGLGAPPAKVQKVNCRGQMRAMAKFSASCALSKRNAHLLGKRRKKQKQKTLLFFKSRA